MSPAAANAMTEAAFQDRSCKARPPYTADSHFHFITMRADLPKVASGDTTRPTAEEAMAIASESIAYTGTYTVDESTRRSTPTSKRAFSRAVCSRDRGTSHALMRGADCAGMVGAATLRQRSPGLGAVGRGWLAGS